MCKEISMFEDIEIEKNRFYHHKSSVPLRDVDIEKVLVSDKISFGEKICKVISKSVLTSKKNSIF